MTEAEADKIAEIIAKVDGGCSVCVRGATQRLMRDFPEMAWKPRLELIAQRDREYWHAEVDGWEPAEPEIDVEER
jgi:hypothetical protein